MITDLRRFESFVSHEIQICRARSAMHFGWMWAFKRRFVIGKSYFERGLSKSNISFGLDVVAHCNDCLVNHRWFKAISGHRIPVACLTTAALYSFYTWQLPKNQHTLYYLADSLSTFTRHFRIFLELLFIYHYTIITSFGTSIKKHCIIRWNVWNCPIAWQ